MSRTNKFNQPCGFVLAFCFSAMLGTTAWAAAPGQINYQGKLADSNGNPIPDASVNLIFQICNDSGGGTCNYSETRNGVPVSNGVFSVVIGQVTPLQSSDFQSGTDKWLKVTVNGTPLTPLQKLVASPYAMAVAENSVGSAEMQNYSLLPVDISTTSDPSDGRLLSYDSTSGGKFKWVDPSVASQWVTNGNDIYYNTG
ncbi:MAG: hypothetical protein HY548_01950, partial [Elusimicrobia bacterium]|nr:hypothetical protein [Elusimicrobiota bacterium]